MQTKAGPVLIAVNPFKEISIYGPNNILAYRNRTSESTYPHVYMTADTAFKAMIRGTYPWLSCSGGSLPLFFSSLINCNIDAMYIFVSSISMKSERFV